MLKKSLISGTLGFIALGLTVGTVAYLGREYGLAMYDRGLSDNLPRYIVINETKEGKLFTVYTEMGWQIPMRVDATYGDIYESFPVYESLQKGRTQETRAIPLDRNKYFPNPLEFKS